MKLFTDAELQEEFRKAIAGDETYHMGKCDMPSWDGTIWNPERPCGGREMFLGIAITGSPPGHDMVYAKFKCQKCGQKTAWPTGYRHRWHPGCHIEWNGTAFACGSEIIGES